eukprot:7069384-Ditylum_brightwellii.AAC.1
MHRVLEDILYQLDHLTEVDCKLIEVYSDMVHLNNRSHMDGGIPDDKDWQQQWLSLSALPSKRYNVPKGKVGRQFIVVHTNLIN